MSVSAAQARTTVLACLAAAAALSVAPEALAQSWLGYNVKRAPNAPWQSINAAQSMLEMKKSGANAVAIVVFLWQPDPSSTAIVRGGDIDDSELAAGIRLARGLGLKVLVKPHVWIPRHWAGEVRPSDPGRWFEAYQRELERIARIAQTERAEALAVGTELSQLATRPEWERVIRAARGQFNGTLTYVASSIDEAESFSHWDRLDTISSSLYPSARVLDDWVRAVRRAGERMAALSKKHRRPLWVAEMGVRSMQGALESPWESPEQRAGGVDLDIQSRAIPAARSNLLSVAAIDAFFVWCWYTDPHAGGATDTDYTPQNKPAQSILNGS